MIGRTEEEDFFAAKLADLQERGGGSGSGGFQHMLIEGAEGMGKTMLMDHVQGLCKRFKIPCYYTVADAMEKNTPWYAWRNIFLQLWDMPALTSLEQIITKEQVQLLTSLVGRQLEEEPQELGEFGSLLNNVVPVFFPENKTVRLMPALAKADKVRDMLLYLLMDPTMDSRPRIFVVEDIQWLDSASRTLIFFAAKRIRQPLFFIFTTREIPNPEENEDLKQFKTHLPGLLHTRLGPLKEADLARVVSRSLKVNIFSSSVPSIIYQQSHGNPFFALEITHALHREGALQIDSRGTCSLDMALYSNSSMATCTDSIESSLHFFPTSFISSSYYYFPLLFRGDSE
jgi:predicted ATPase